MVGKICTVCRNCSFNNKNMSFFTYPGDAKRRYEWLKAVGRLDLTEKLENDKTRCNHRICELHFEEKYMKITKAPKHLNNGRRKILTKDAFPTLNIDSVPEELVPEKLKPKKRALRDESKKMEYSIKIITPKDLEDKESKQIPSDIVSSFCESVIKTSVATQTYTKCYCSEENKKKSDFHSDLDQKNTMILKVFKEKDESCSNLDSVLKQCQNCLPKSLCTIIQWQLGSKQTGHNDYINYLALNLYYLKSPYKLLKKFLNLPSIRSLKQYLIPKSTNIYDNLKLFSVKVNHMSDKERICSVAVTCVKVNQNLYYNIKYDRIIGFLDVNGRQTIKPAEIAIILVAQGIFDNWIQPVSYALFSGDYNEDVSNWIDEVLIQLLNIGLDVKAFVSNLQFKYACFKNISPEQCYFTMNGRNIYYIYDVMQITEYVNAKIAEISTEPNSLTISKDLIVELNLVNFFNSSNVKCDRTAKLIEAQEIMKQLISLQNNDIFIVYALVTLNSIIHLSDLMNELSDNFLTTNLLSLSNYLNRFNILRLNPECTAREINKFFVNTFVNNMLKMPIRRKGNSNNLDAYIQDILTKDIKTINRRSSLNVFTIDYRHKLSDKNSFPHVCEYLYLKCLDQHYCSVLKIIHKTKEKTPPIAFKKFVKELENIFSNYFKNNYEIESDIGRSLLREMSRSTFEMPCFCFPVDYLKSLFIRAKLYFMIRKNNRLFKQTNDKLFKVCKIANFRIHSK